MYFKSTFSCSFSVYLDVRLTLHSCKYQYGEGSFRCAVDNREIVGPVETSSYFEKY